MLPSNCFENANSALSESLPFPGREGSHWVIHYSPVIVWSGASRREAFLVIDRVALYVMLFPEDVGCCPSPRPANAERSELRIPLFMITAIAAEGLNS